MRLPVNSETIKSKGINLGYMTAGSILIMTCSLWVSNKEEESDMLKCLELILIVREAFPPLPSKIEPPS